MGEITRFLATDDYGFAIRQFAKYGNLNVSLASHFVGKITAVLLSASVNEHEPMSGSLSQNVCLCSTDPSLSSRLRSFAFGFLR